MFSKHHVGLGLGLSLGLGLGLIMTHGVVNIPVAL